MSNYSVNVGDKTFLSDEMSLTPHPGIYHGQYPTKKPVEYTRMEAMLRRGKKWVTDCFRSGSREDKKILDAIYAQYELVMSMNDKHLDDAIVEIKQQLHEKGLSETLMFGAFAIIKEVANREINMPHYDSQLLGGWILMQGMVAEMQTGEGKTLTATLPASCAAMANMPVHVVTVNDYLVERDAELMRPVYARLGLSVGCIIEGMSEDERKQAYSCDITYCTSQQLAFDYLRDRMHLKQYRSDLDLKLSSLYRASPLEKNLLMRGLCFAVVDEADSVLIDEARTPLILSCKADNTQQEELHREAVWIARQVDNPIYYTINVQAKQVSLTAHGKTYVQELTADMGGLWRGERRRNSLIEQALSALHCYKKDIQYIIDDGHIVIIDDNTGRSMPDRSWEAGLHQMIEEKEECEQSGENQTLARISYQRFFSRYLKLSGMTGTATEVAGELWSTFGLAVRQVPTHKPVQRINESASIYYTHEEKWQAVVDDVISKQAQNTPVLVGVRTVLDSEHISELLSLKHVEHQVLNAKHHKQEAEIVAAAGKAGSVTVATNMAGRGTDIQLDEDAKTSGGLHVICCERNDSRRIDRQLAGRCARQGDPGSFKEICSIEDDAVIKFFSVITLALLRYRMKRQLPMGKCMRPGFVAKTLIAISQRITEYHHRQIRKSLIKVDEKRESMLAFTGKSE